MDSLSFSRQAFDNGSLLRVHVIEEYVKPYTSPKQRIHEDKSSEHMFQRLVDSMHAHECRLELEKNVERIGDKAIELCQRVTIRMT